MLVPSVSWLVVMLLLSPAISLIAVTLIVRGSAKAQSVEESQQAAVFLIIPLILLIAGQFTGVLLMNVLDSSRPWRGMCNTRLGSFAKIYGTVYLRKTFAIEKSSVQRCIEPSFYSTCSIKSSSTPAADRQRVLSRPKVGSLPFLFNTQSRYCWVSDKFFIWTPPFTIFLFSGYLLLATYDIKATDRAYFVNSKMFNSQKNSA